MGSSTTGPEYTLSLVHQADEFIEQILSIVRASLRFRMILNAENGELFVSKSLDRVVVQVDMG